MAQQCCYCPNVGGTRGRHSVLTSRKVLRSNFAMLRGSLPKSCTGRRTSGQRRGFKWNYSLSLDDEIPAKIVSLVRYRNETMYRPSLRLSQAWPSVCWVPNFTWFAAWPDCRWNLGRRLPRHCKFEAGGYNCSSEHQNALPFNTSRLTSFFFWRINH